MHCYLPKYSFDKSVCEPGQMIFFSKQQPSLKNHPGSQGYLALKFKLYHFQSHVFCLNFFHLQRVKKFASNIKLLAHKIFNFLW